ncbi:MAG: L-rhamnose mutarotase [Prevotellaceae bacterium]|nr:L-rhamnose mutarotase [Prevotellaceae bacterium]
MTTNEGYAVKAFRVPTKRYCQVLSLKDAPEGIARYRSLHSPQKVWPEVLEGIRKVGILEMEIYISGNQLCMIVEAPVDFRWDEAMRRLASLPRQAEWERCVEPYQQCEAGASSSQKWQPMERMFHLYSEEELSRP